MKAGFQCDFLTAGLRIIMMQIHVTSGSGLSKRLHVHGVIVILDRYLLAMPLVFPSAPPTMIPM